MKLHFIGKLAGVALIFLGSTTASGSQPASAMEGRLNALVAAEEAMDVDSDPGPLLRKVFAEKFGDISSASLAALSSEDVRFYLRASKMLAFYTFDPTYLDHQEEAFSVLESRESVDEYDFSAMFKSYVEFREFARARAIAARYPSFEHERLPGFRDITEGRQEGPSLISLHDDGTITRVPADIAKAGPQVIVAAHPLCHFSENAIRAIKDDPVLPSLFAGHTIWLMPQDQQLNVAEVRAWNQEFADYQMQWAYDTADWPMVKRWSTPTFYFFREGRLVTTVSGWPEEGRRADLLEAFRQVGLTPAEPHQPSK